jgi:isopentenyl-diphosphate delta-isomerase
VLGGRYDGPVRPDPAEAEGYAWVESQRLRRDVAAAPGAYSVWFRKYLLEHWPELIASAAWETV